MLPLLWWRGCWWWWWCVLFGFDTCICPSFYKKDKNVYLVSKNAIGSWYIYQIIYKIYILFQPPWAEDLAEGACSRIIFILLTNKQHYSNFYYYNCLTTDNQALLFQLFLLQSCTNIQLFKLPNCVSVEQSDFTHSSWSWLCLAR